MLYPHRVPIGNIINEEIDILKEISFEVLFKDAAFNTEIMKNTFPYICNTIVFQSIQETKNLKVSGSSPATRVCIAESTVQFLLKLEIYY